MKALLDHLPALTLPEVILPGSFVSAVCSLTDSEGVCNCGMSFLQHGVRFKGFMKKYFCFRQYFVNSFNY